MENAPHLIAIFSGGKKLEYDDFLKSKQLTTQRWGVDVEQEQIHPLLFDFQKDSVQWAVRKGRAAIFYDTGLGKTFMQLEWARLIGERTLIVAPLSVARQTQREALKIDLDIHYVRSQEDVDIMSGTKLFITNYEMVDKFDPSAFGAVVLDESSILKAIGSKTRKKLTKMFADTPYKLCCTATPAPNDYTELGNHVEFLGICKLQEMLSMFFINANKEHTYHIDGKVYRRKGSNKGGQEWRLKHHAEEPFFRWLSSWAMALIKPSDLGYDDDGFILPPLRLHTEFIQADYKPEDQLFFTHIKGIKHASAIRRHTAPKRLEVLKELVNGTEEQWIIWTGLNTESKMVADAFPDAVEVKGSDSAESKATSLEAFQNGEHRILVSKARIAGYGLNLQCASKMAFFGLSYCYDEQTEILTNRGWLSFGNVMKSDYVATLNQDTLSFEWQQPQKIIWRHYSGDMVKFKGQRNFDLLVTPNHKMFVTKCPVRFENDAEGWHLKEAKELVSEYKKQKFRMLSCPSIFRGNLRTGINIPPVAGQRINTRSRLITRIDIVPFLKLVGWYLTEGYCHPTGVIHISQSFAKPENRKEITGVMTTVGLNVNNSRQQITGSSKNLAQYLIHQFGTGANHKHIPGWVKELDTSHLVILRDTMLKGDGLHLNGHPRGYRTNSKQLADDFQEICLKTGIRASVKMRCYEENRLGQDTFYDVNLAWTNTHPSIYNKPSIVQYDGLIGCVTVPNHVVLVRRNGIPVFCGNSWEQFYQCIRREWRYMQPSPVDVHIIMSDIEASIYANIMRKDAMAKRLREQLIDQVRIYEEGELKMTTTERTNYEQDTVTGDGWTAMLGDSCERLKELDENSVDLSVYSPPFADLFVYTDSERDLGNSRDWDEFFEHYTFIIREVLRVTKPGRLTCVHTSDIPAMAQKDGYIGIKDFPGTVIKAYEAEGWIFTGRAFISKNPQAQAIRTHAQALLFVQLAKDSAKSRPALIDQVLLFKKAGDNEVPVTPVQNGEMDNELWIQWANGIWTDISETDTLQFSKAREGTDEKHICPLQLETIERCVKLWSNPGELILSPFLGIGSEGYQALKFGRQFVGIELKRSYFDVAIRNLKKAEVETNTQDLFAFAELEL